MRARLPISASRFSSALTPAETPITQMRPPVASAVMFSAKLGAPTSSRITSNGPCSPKPSGAIASAPSSRHLSARLLAAHGRRHARAGRLAELYRRRAHPPGAAVHEQALARAQFALREERVVGRREDLGQRHPPAPSRAPRAPASAGARAPPQAPPVRPRRRSPSHGRRRRSVLAPGPSAWTSPASSKPGMSAGEPGGAGYSPRRCIMSAPLIPAARTRTSTSPTPGTGSGCSSTRISFSRIVTARMRAKPIFCRNLDTSNALLHYIGRLQ